MKEVGSIKLLNMLRGHSFEHYFKDHNVLVSITIRKDTDGEVLYTLWLARWIGWRLLGLKRKTH